MISKNNSKTTLRFQKISDGSASDSGLCERQLNVLAHAQIISLDIGSQCGGHGVCGGDRVRLKSNADVSPITDKERVHLSAQELEQGWRLACQCFPNSVSKDIVFEY